MSDGPSGVLSSIDTPLQKYRILGSDGSHGSHESHGPHGSKGLPGSQGSQGLQGSQVSQVPTESQQPYGYMDVPAAHVGGSHEGHDSPAMSHHGHGPSSHKDHGGDGGHMGSMAFHASDTETILFKFWHTQSASALGLSCLLIFVVAVLYEGLKFYREWLFQRNRAKRLDAGRDHHHYGHHSGPHRHQDYRYKTPTYSYRVQPQHQQDHLQIYPYRTAPSSVQPHQHTDPIGPLSDQSSHLMSHHHRHHHLPHSMEPSSTQAAQKMPLHDHHHMQHPIGSPSEQSSHILPMHHSHLPHGPGHHHIQQEPDPGVRQKIPWRQRFCSRLHLIQTFLHVLQVLISFLLMLVFMTFNVWLCLAVLLGAGVGYYIFGAFSNRINEHCN